VHEDVPWSHAWSTGQSPIVRQPHLPPKHADPALAPRHEMHAPPSAPHESGFVPEAHRPALQQPPLQGCELEQAVVHEEVAMSHA